MKKIFLLLFLLFFSVSLYADINDDSWPNGYKWLSNKWMLGTLQIEYLYHETQESVAFEGEKYIQERVPYFIDIYNADDLQKLADCITRFYYENSQYKKIPAIWILNRIVYPSLKGQLSDEEKEKELKQMLKSINLAIKSEEIARKTISK